MFLTAEEFLGHFPPVTCSREDFPHRLTVTYTIPQSLAQLLDRIPPKVGRHPIIKESSDLRYLRREEIIDYFYEIIVTKRHHYLRCFYQSFFAFKTPTQLTWTGADLRLQAAIKQNSHNPKELRPVDTEEKDKDIEPQSAATEGGEEPADSSDEPDEAPLVPLANYISMQKNDASRVMIRNLHYLELLHHTRITNTVQSHTSFWGSLTSMYNDLRLPDRMFAKSSIALFLRPKNTKKNLILKEINYNTLYYLFQAYQPKASILNPYALKWILGELFPGARSLFTPVLSWSSYLVAMMHSPSINYYCGLDVMPSVCAKTQFLATYYQGLGSQFSAEQKEVEILCQPSESLLDDASFFPRQEGRFEAILLCPPYYDMEIYHEGEQSIQSYPEYSQWLQGYWRPTVEACARAARTGGRLGVIINNYHDLYGRFYPLCRDLHAITSEHFQLLDIYYLYNRTSPLRAASKARYERLYLYQRL